MLVISDRERPWISIVDHSHTELMCVLEGWKLLWVNVTYTELKFGTCLKYYIVRPVLGLGWYWQNYSVKHSISQNESY